MGKFIPLILAFLMATVSLQTLLESDHEASIENLPPREIMNQVSTQLTGVSNDFISVGEDVVCAVLTDGSVSCWGNNVHGMLGIGILPEYEQREIDGIGFSSSPASVSGLPADDPAIQVSVGAQIVCTVTQSGDVYCWGRGGYVGDGTQEDRSEATKIYTGVSMAKVDVGYVHTCGLSTNGDVLCWGKDHGLGDGVERERNAFALTPNYTASFPDGRKAIDIGVSSGNTCAILDNGSRSCWSNEEIPSDGFHYGGNVSAIGLISVPFENDLGNPGWCTILDNNSIDCNDHPIWIKGFSVDLGWISPAPRTLAVGPGHACLVDQNYSLMCWGFGKGGALGNGEWTNQQEPVLIDSFSSEDPFVSVSAGEMNTCAVARSGKAYCWGYHSQYGQIGDGTVYSVYEQPKQIDLISGFNNITQMRNSWGLKCAIDDIGNLGCWGDLRINPIYVHQTSTFGGAVVDVNIFGVFGTCALIDDGSIWCWGVSSTEIPEKVSQFGTNRVAVAFDDNGFSACAVEQTGHVSCWGNGESGTIGDGNWENRDEPTRTQSFGPSLRAIDVKISLRTACALVDTGQVYCWGSDHDGSLGDGGGNAARNTPSLISTPLWGNRNATSISGGSSFCALLNDGEINCWGDNMFGAVGDGTTENRDAPVIVANLSQPAYFIEKAYSGQCALIAGGEMYCWGLTLEEMTGSRTSPKLAFQSDLIDLNTTFQDRCFVFTKQDIRCWGTHDLINRDFNRTIPTAVADFGEGRLVMGAVLDLDNDTVLDEDDNCPSIPNQDQTDTDGDEIGDVCDPDDDNDGLLDHDDDCPLHDQTTDSNCNGITDLDEDSDGDGVLNEFDECEGHDDKIDSDNNGIPDGCDDKAQPETNTTNSTDMNDFDIINQTSPDQPENNSEQQDSDSTQSSNELEFGKYGLLITVVILVFFTIVKFVKRKETTVQVDDIGDPVEKYAQQLIAQGYEPEYARTYAEHFYAHNK